MKTDDLIRALAADAPAPAPPRVLALALLPLALAFAVVAVRVVLGFRSDLATVPFNPLSAARIVLPLMLTAIAIRAALRLAQPGTRAPLWPLAVVPLAAAGLVGWELATTPPADWGTALMGKMILICLVSIPILSVLPVAAIFAALRRGAVTDPRRAGFCAGLAGSGGGTAAYALFCPTDNPLFYVVWFGLAILAVTAVCTWAGPRLLRW